MELNIQLVQSAAQVLVFNAIAVAICIQPAFGAAIGEGYAVAKAVEAIGRQPEARSGITSTMLVGCAVTETSGIYGLVLAFIILFVNPLFASFVSFVQAFM